MIKFVEHKGESYPAWEASGNAARFAIPFAKEVCIGYGVDVGAGKVQWAFPGAHIVDPKVIDDGHHACNLPKDRILDYIFSSHCLEHLPNWVDAMDHWYDSLKPDGGILFLYLPHPDQKYWLPWNNRKHIHILHPEMIWEYLCDKGYKNVMISDMDLNHSYVVIAEK